MIVPFLTLLCAHQKPAISRDEYGVPHIQASTVSDAFFQAGYAVAQDRLWQMESSRRLARGRLSEVFGKALVNSDREILSTGYTDEELQQQFDQLPAPAQQIINSYVAGINEWIAEPGDAGLPAGFAQNGFKPQPWTRLDSVAITIHLLQQFGRGGAGELRNMAALAYLQGQKALGTHTLDVWDDLAWFNDPDAIPTVSPGDDPLNGSHPSFYLPDRKTTLAHLAKLPKLSLMQLLGGIRMAERQQSTLVAENLNTPFRSGSYCVVVNSSKSATGHSLLLSGPQMGMRAPSIAHEMSIEAPGLSTVGMDIPGVPGVIIGHTKNFAWGLTTGEADTEDIFAYPTDPTGYRVGQQAKTFQKIHQILPVKGGDSIELDQTRTVFGPVVLNAGGAVFSRRSSFWMREMSTFGAWVDLWSADSPSSIDAAIDKATLNFNFFYATAVGDIGWRYTGLVPKRAPGIDPRFPTPGEPQYDWRGFLSTHEMPHVRNPRSGFLANWNNKPSNWWPNLDTPAWGKIFHNRVLLDALQKPLLTAQDLERAAWFIARTDDTWSSIQPYVDRERSAPGYELLKGFDGSVLDGSRQASSYLAFLSYLRQELFLKSTGNFLNPDYFNTVLQPSLILKVLEGHTKFDYLGKGTTGQAVRAALARLASAPPAPYRASTFPSLESTPIPYSNRGTYLQIVESNGKDLFGRSVLPPGIAESGPHSHDQSPLARAWLYKPMRFR